MSAMMSGRLAALAIPILTARATRINAAHRNALAAGRSMLAYAVEAGEELIAAKGERPHGTFQKWCAENLTFHMETARDYMKLAKTRDLTGFDPALSINAALSAIETPRPAAPLPQFTQDDAERILKLAAMANGGNVNEEIVACEMLDKMASRFGMTLSDAECYPLKTRDFDCH